MVERNPITVRPIITRDDLSNGFVQRYFVQHSSAKSYIVEVNKIQYNAFKNTPGYVVISLPWSINGNANTFTEKGVIFLGARDKNIRVIQLYERQMSGLSKVLFNPLEYFQGVDNRTN